MGSGSEHQALLWARVGAGRWLCLERNAAFPLGPGGGTPLKVPGWASAVTAPGPPALSDSHPLSRARDPHYSAALPQDPVPVVKTPLLLGPGTTGGVGGGGAPGRSQAPPGPRPVMLFVSGNTPVPKLGSPIGQQVGGGGGPGILRKKGGATGAPGLGRNRQDIPHNQGLLRRGCRAHYL